MCTIACTHTRAHARQPHTHTDCRHPPSPSSCPWAWQSGHGRYQRVGEAWKHRLRLWVRSVCSCESAFVGDKMAMSEQLESEGGKSVLLTFSFLPFSQLTRWQEPLRSNKTVEKKNFWFVFYLKARTGTAYLYQNAVQVQSLTLLTLTKVNLNRLHL